MTPFLVTLALDLILISPFIGAACLIVLATRALAEGEVNTSARHAFPLYT